MTTTDTTLDARTAVFLDRDNTLIHDPGYLKDSGLVALLPGVTEGLARLRAAGYQLIVVSNQSGVARGLLTEADVVAVNARVQALLEPHGAAIDAFYHCPFLPGDEAIVAEFRRDSDLRKPKPGMLLLAAKEHHIDLTRSWMIGDSVRDVEAGRAAGCRTILIARGGSAQSDAADHVEPTFSAAAMRILEEGNRNQGTGAIN
ncbi:MAG: HAD family hydrolase [Planctomycetes bacterium]|nr:HAD family hydrolase [Planctomycetota bacterium]